MSDPNQVLSVPRASASSASLASLDSSSSDAILATALGFSLELGSPAGSTAAPRIQLQAQAAYRPAASVPCGNDARPVEVDMQVDYSDDGDVPKASIDDISMGNNGSAATPRPTMTPSKRKRRPSSLPSVDSLLTLIPPNNAQARTPPPTSAHHFHEAVALAAESDSLHIPSLPTSPLLLTPLDPLASLFSGSNPRPATVATPPHTPTLAPHLRRARGGSCAPRPSSLLAKLDHLPMELLHLIAEYVFATPARACSDPMLATRPHTHLAHLARVCQRVYSAVAPVLYLVPAIESVVQLRRLAVTLQVAALRTFFGASAGPVLVSSSKCQVHPLATLVPVFAYVRGLDISRLEDGARGKREVAALVARVFKVARVRSAEQVRQVVLVGRWEAVDPTLGVGACMCLTRVTGGDVREAPSASTPSPSSLRRTASNGDLQALSKADSATVSVYGMDLSSSTSPLLASNPSSPTSSSSSEYLPPPRLTHINLSFIKSLTPALLTTLLFSPTSAPLRLTHLNLSGTHLPDSLFASLLTDSAPTLTRLSLAWNPYLTDLALASLATPGIPLKLTHLDLTHCRDLSDWSLAKLAPVLPQLRALGIAWCPRISGRVVHAALSYWPHLRALSVAGCPRVGGREAVMRMWDGYVIADVELRRRVGRVSELVGSSEAAFAGRGVGVVERVQRLRVDDQEMGGCVYYLDV